MQLKRLYFNLDFTDYKQNLKSVNLPNPFSVSSIAEIHL